MDGRLKVIFPLFEADFPPRFHSLLRNCTKDVCTVNFTSIAALYISTLNKSIMEVAVDLGRRSKTQRAGHGEVVGTSCFTIVQRDSVITRSSISRIPNTLLLLTVRLLQKTVSIGETGFLTASHLATI